jgi:hypothetical protein
VDNFDNGLAGWVANFELQTFNQNDICTFNLLDQAEVNITEQC